MKSNELFWILISIPVFIFAIYVCIILICMRVEFKLAEEIKQYAITRARHIKWLHRAIAVEDLCEDLCDTFGYECDTSVLDYIAAHVRDTDNTPNKLLGCIICGGYTVKPEYKELLERVIEDRETKVITAMLIREILDKDEVQGNEKIT